MYNSLANEGAKANVRVMLVDDSAIVRGMLRQIIEKESGLEVVFAAPDGKVGVKQYVELKPDVVTMDIEMPEMNGIEALQEILKIDPDAKVIMCSSLTQSGASMTVKALELGAVDCLAKPTSSSVDRSGNFSEQLLMRLKAFAKTKTYAPKPSTPSETKASSVSTPPQQPTKPRTTFTVRDYPSSMSVYKPQILVIGSSTGGPKALSTVLNNISKTDLPPVLITQHMPAGFTKMLAESLAKETGLNVVEAQEDMLVKSGQIYIAPGGKHLKIEKRTSGIFTTLDDGPQINFCKPAVDVMMDSILKVYETGILSVILTGMGHDGLEGCQKIMDASNKNLLLAQDEATSVVWGMPAAVAKAGICNAVLPLDDIAPAINALLKGQKP